VVEQERKGRSQDLQSQGLQLTAQQILILSSESKCAYIHANITHKADEFAEVRGATVRFSQMYLFSLSHSIAIQPV